MAQPVPRVDRHEPQSLLVEVLTLLAVVALFILR